MGGGYFFLYILAPYSTTLRMYRKFKRHNYYFTDAAGDLYFLSPQSSKYERLKGADSASFKVLHNFYGHDKQAIFYGSKCLVRGYTSFTDYSASTYMQIDGDLYYGEKKIKTNFKGELTNIGGIYYTDGKDLIVLGKFFTFDAKSFVILDDSLAKDKKRVFNADTVIASADAKTFRVIPENAGLPAALRKKFTFLVDEGPYSWTADKKHLYFCGEVHLEGKIDPASTRVFGSSVLLDKNHVYYFDTLVEGADPATFEPIVEVSRKIKNTVDRIKFFTAFYKDKNNIYYGYEDGRGYKNDRIIVCSKENRRKYQDDLKRITRNYGSFNLTAREIERIKALTGK
jgi:hypothetical protein